ncbi:MAG: FAD-dependent oxidoreductase [Rhodospirillaceae bacterium]|nr:FAD-dependent oxidoreductase [Alphaproteobacteria bacterium]MBT4687937.1 FAD-dependent oxidoreductase [Rhodospirillaceae bacterium]MBT5079443.1 FAD-dependent oxidoreductase [Rhodospirillaceae bacterium]MBT5526912.1 FAD-dependent oxidoreductase [Rhodospirillaceae bacterium]MBT5878442.1 FAD-dependent oxidoreductase [Rhodospirillaceae bacterium]
MAGTTSSRAGDTKYDIAVLGGGMAGCVAALAARREGARLLLVERAGCLGGAATSGSVAQFVGWSTRSGRVVVQGLAQEITAQLQSIDAAGNLDHFTMSTGNVMDRINYDPDALKMVLDQMMLSAGIDVLFHTSFAGAEKDGGRVSGMNLAAPGGLLGVEASTFIDASGDMALLGGVGATFLTEADHGRQPATMMFAMAPIDFSRLDAVGQHEKAAIIARGLKTGALPRAALHYSRVPGSDVAWFNISRVQVDATDPFSLSAGEMEGRAQARRISRFIRETLPGCANARLSQIAPALGVRETRRVAGDHVLRVDELREGLAFEDTIACGAYPIDIHHSDDAELTFEEFGEDHFYRIPFRSLLPVGLENVAAAGRGLSAEAAAFAAVRVMPSAMAIGHAAGAAAAIAARDHNGAYRNVSVLEIQTTLRQQNAFLGN